MFKSIKFLFTNRITKGPMYILLVVFIFSIYHQSRFFLESHEWGLTFLWIPIFASPAWILVGLSELSERRKNKNG